MSQYGQAPDLGLRPRQLDSRACLRHHHTMCLHETHMAGFSKFMADLKTQAISVGHTHYLH